MIYETDSGQVLEVQQRKIVDITMYDGDVDG